MSASWRPIRLLTLAAFAAASLTSCSELTDGASGSDSYSISSDSPSGSSSVRTPNGTLLGNVTSATLGSGYTSALVERDGDCWLLVALGDKTGTVTLDSTSSAIGSHVYYQCTGDGYADANLAGRVTLVSRSVDVKNQSGTFTINLSGAHIARTGAAASALRDAPPGVTQASGASDDFSGDISVQVTETSNSGGGSGGTGGGGSTGGGSGGGTGGGSASCVNDFRIVSMRGYYSFAYVTSPKTVTGTGSRLGANGGYAIQVVSDETIEGFQRYWAQIIINGSPRTGTFTIIDDGQIPGAEKTNGGIAKLSYSVGKDRATGQNVTDTFWSNLDFGSNKNMGTVVITSVSPKIIGTFSFQASGDGYPSLSNYFATVDNGHFCVTP